MPTRSNTIWTRDTADTALVAAALEGDRNAFGAIVSRYQNLLCALAYAAVGDQSHSEDIAQEAFVDAWRQLDALQEPEKLKAWLCGILRFKVSRFLRKEVNQPVRHAEELDEQRGYGVADSQTEDGIIRDEEQALLWGAIQKVPETYREPLVLFYREDQSTRQVAQALDLTESAVKQRLSRGRKLLQAEMMGVVETTLTKSKPGAAFAASVMALVAAVPPPAKAATLGGAAAKAGSTFKWANVLAFAAAFSGAVSTFFGIRAGLAQSRTERERRRVFQVAGVLFFYPVLVCGLLFFMRHQAMNSTSYAFHWAAAAQLVVVVFVVSYGVLVFRMLRGSRDLRAQERLRDPDAFDNPIDRPGSAAREYESRIKIAGIPLFHFRLSSAEPGDKPVVAWLAGGETAYGLLFAWGGFAVAPVAVGIYSVGLVSIGAVGVGALGLGTVGLGVISFGVAAVGYKAYASISSLGWESAFSAGVSMAREGAIGPVAFANAVNNERAAEIVDLAIFGQTYLWVLGLIAVLVIVPSVWYSRKVRERLGPASD
ncbi:MAG: sigma-70 family RNA polymerase sigma factor [Pseudomonadota bacterium]